MATKRNTGNQFDAKSDPSLNEDSVEVTLEEALAEEAAADADEKSTNSSPSKVPKAKADTPDPDEGFTILVEKGEANKISPNAEGLIFYQVAKKDEDGSLYVRIDSNETGGLHSREWIALTDIIELLRGQKSNDFSTILKSVIVGKSRNNTSFLAGILRSEGIALIQASPEGIFLHRLAANFDAQAEKLLALS
ncbi:hypothetical protein [Oceanospirillum sanctuarii]|uniref:hypothetical protein n=1 Tax=Oceanospirillum sanctuarii TaxID=1434821 RepID=UPI000A373FB7|nr:hypothetical protein [Oceanospirillum sanctuarii]